MSGEINRVPWGLLDLLDMKARGQNPRVLSSALDPSIELRDLYLLQDRETVIGQTSAISSVGLFGDTSSPVGTLVPQNQLWYLWNVTTTPTGAFTGAASAMRWTVGLLSGAFPNFQGIASLDWQPGVGDYPCLAAPGGFWMKGGDSIACLVSEWDTFTANPSIILAAQITRLAV